MATLHLLRRPCRLISMTPSTLEHSLVTLQQALECSDEQLAQLVCQAPNLLTSNAASLMTKLDALKVGRWTQQRFEWTSPPANHQRFSGTPAHACVCMTVQHQRAHLLPPGARRS
jgi:hypothetical protein